MYRMVNMTCRTKYAKHKLDKNITIAIVTFTVPQLDVQNHPYIGYAPQIQDLITQNNFITPGHHRHVRRKKHDTAYFV